MPTRSRKSPTAGEIAEMATRGEDVSRFFTNQFTVVRPVRRVNPDGTQAESERVANPEAGHPGSL